MNKPSGVGLFFFPNSSDELGSVALPPILRFMRPVTFGLWLVVFAIQMHSAATTSEGINWVLLVLTTLLFAGVHAQFWLDESDQGRRAREGFERMRGQIYEDDDTGLPNSRHFVFQLRRQMMRSVRNGRGFSIVLATINGLSDSGDPSRDVLRAASASMKECLGDGDFVARLQGSSFGAIVLDEAECTATDKAEQVKEWLGDVAGRSSRNSVTAAVSITGYEGELEVRDFLRRAQRDLQASQDSVSHPGTAPRSSEAA